MNFISHGGALAVKAAVQLSKEFIAAEKNALADGAKDWVMTFAVNDWRREASMIKAAGFSQMRAHMLQACKN